MQQDERNPLYQRVEGGVWWVKKFKNSVGTKIPRHSTERRNYQKALKYFHSLDLLEKWEGRKSAKKAATKEPDKGLLNTEALEIWLKEAKNGKLRETTRDNYREVVTRVWIKPMAALGMDYLAEPRTEHARAMQEEWIVVKGNKLNTVLGYRRPVSTMYDWLIRHKQLDYVKNPWVAVVVPEEIPQTEEQRRERRPADDGVATLPLDMDGDENWQKIHSNLVPFLESRAYTKNPLALRPQSCLALAELLYTTGLRRGDAAFFRPDWIEYRDGKFSYTCIQEKTNWPVTVLLSPELATKLQALPLLPWRGEGKYKEWSTAGLYPFWDGSGKNFKQYLDDNINQPLHDLGECLGIPGSVRPHRFRDSFAVNLLNRLVSQNVDAMRMLSEALGHKTIKTTEKYYAPKVLSRVKMMLLALAAAQRPKAA